MDPKGQYIPNSSYYIGIMPNGEKRYYVCDDDYFEDLEYEKNRKKFNDKIGEEYAVQ